MASGMGCMATSGESQMEKGLKHENGKWDHMSYGLNLGWQDL